MYGGFVTTTRRWPLQLRGQRGEPRAFGHAHPHGAGSRHPATFARATASASGSTSVAQTSASGSANASASASAPEPVPRSATAYAVSAPPQGSGGAHPLAGPRDLGDRDLRDDLGLGTRDQHPAVDEQVDAAEAPRAEHVLQRLTGESPRDQLVERGRAAHRRGRVGFRDLLGRVEPGHLLEHPAHLDAGLLDAAVARAAPRRRAGSRSR